MNSCSGRLRKFFHKTSSLSSYQTTRRHTPWRAVRISNTYWNSWPERKLVAMDSPSWPLTPATVSRATSNAAYPIAPCSTQSPVTTTLTASWLAADCGASVTGRYHAHPTAQMEGKPPHGNDRQRWASGWQEYTWCTCTLLVVLDMSYWPGYWLLLRCTAKMAAAQSVETSVTTNPKQALIGLPGIQCA